MLRRLVIGIMDMRRWDNFDASWMGWGSRSRAGDDSAGWLEKVVLMGSLDNTTLVSLDKDQTGNLVAASATCRV